MRASWPDARRPSSATPRRSYTTRPAWTRRVCQEKLQELLLAGSRVRDPQGRSLFAFKLHQFIGKGDTVYTTLETPAKRFLTTQYQRSAPNRPAGQPLFPLAFCRECGQDFLVVNLERGGESFSPRIPNSDLVEHPDADGLLLHHGQTMARSPRPCSCSTWSLRTGWCPAERSGSRQGSNHEATQLITCRRVRNHHRRRYAGGVLRTARNSARHARRATRAPASPSSPASPALAPKVARAP